MDTDTTQEAPLLLNATFQSYDHKEEVVLHMPAHFWTLNSADRAELMDDEYDTWLEGGRRQWSIDDEEPADAAD